MRSSSCSAFPKSACASCPTRSPGRSPPRGRAPRATYVLAVGTVEPRKNLPRLVEAARRCRARAPRRGCPRLGRRRASPGDGVRWLGFVDDEELARLYRGAACFAYPSLYEGFGIPVLEAMACGTPVVTSAGGALEELAGGAAVLVDPRRRGLDRRGLEQAAGTPRRAGPRRSGARPRLHVGGRRARRRSPSTARLPHEARAARRGRARAAPHRGRDVRPEPLARLAGARRRGGARLAAATRHPELVPDGVEPVELAAGSQEIRMAWRVPRLLRRLRPSLAHFQHALPPRPPCPTVVTLHDLSFQRSRHAMPLTDTIAFRATVPRSARRATRVIAVSERTKRDIVELYGVPPERIAVIPHGVDPAFSPAADGPTGGLPALRRRDPAAQGPAHRGRCGRRRRASARRRRTGEGPEAGRRAAPSRRRSPRIRRQGRAGRALPARRRARAAVALRGLRTAGAGGDGLRDAGRRRCGAGAARGRGRRRGPRGGRPVRRSRAHGARRSSSGSSRAGLERARLFSWEEAARRTVEVYVEALA